MMSNMQFSPSKFLFVITVLLCSIFSYAIAQNPIGQAGKIWYDQGFLYVNVVNEGVVVINNYNPKSPRKVGFVQIPGNVDLAVRGTVMFANNNRDLVAIDISDLKNVKELARISNVFNHRNRSSQWSSDGNQDAIAWRTGENMFSFVPLIFGGNNTSTGRALSNLFNTRNTNMMGIGTTGISNPLMMSLNQPNTPSTGGASKGGSMACFTIVGNYLYAIDAFDLQIFDISEVKKPRLVGQKVNIGSDIETIFPSGNNLFIGSQTGMYIYDITDPLAPRRMGRYAHTRSCDPVVVEGNYAFVTLRDGTDCAGGVNQLDVIDIGNPSFPRKLKTYRMTNPHGLGIDNGLLFVCDGRDGLKVYDARDVGRIDSNQIAHFRNINTYDVIPDQNRKILMMVGSNKITQYDYNNPKSLVQLSEIDVLATF
jgi:hypothetical protein